MSGNKYHDILENFDESEKGKLQILLDFMERYHPKIEIDRVFQRDLKSRLLKKSSRKGRSWYSTLSYLSIFATSFILLFGIWKIWGIPTQLSNDSGRYSLSVPLSRSTIEDKAEGMNQDNAGNILQKDDIISNSDSFSSVADSNEPTISSKNTKGVSPPENREKSDQLAKATSLAPEDTISLSDEINNISNEINTIATTSSQQSSDPEYALASTKMLVESPMFEMSEPPQVLPIDYPIKMAIYKKGAPWSQTEIDSRTGSGMVKKLEITLKKDVLREKLIKNGEIVDATIEYRRARKSSDQEYYIVPCVRTLNANKEPIFTALISGYILD